jgi:hypothetical protein
LDFGERQETAAKRCQRPKGAHFLTGSNLAKQGSAKTSAAAEAKVTTIIEEQRTRRLLIEKLSNVAIVALWVYGAVQIAQALAGHTTTAEFIFQVLGGKKAACTLAAAAGGGGLWYGRVQHRMRRKVIERDHPRVVALEQRLDPNRQSASLTPQGDTIPEDKR